MLCKKSINYQNILKNALGGGYFFYFVTLRSIEEIFLPEFWLSSRAAAFASARMVSSEASNKGPFC